MMALLYHWVLSQSLVLYGAVALGGAGLMASWLLPALNPYRYAAKIAGVLFFAVALYLAGYQSADDRFDHERQIAAERDRSRLLTLERDASRRDLALQKIAAEKASKERDALSGSQSVLQKKVAEYEEAERNAVPAAPNLACDGAVITDRDVRWRRGLRSPK